MKNKIIKYNKLYEDSSIKSNIIEVKNSEQNEITKIPSNNNNPNNIRLIFRNQLSIDIALIIDKSKILTISDIITLLLSKLKIIQTEKIIRLFFKGRPLAPEEKIKDLGIL